MFDLLCFSHLLSVSFSHLCLPKLLRTLCRYGLPVNSNVGVKTKKTMRIKDIYSYHISWFIQSIYC